ncbi:MAG: hypothetical protein MI974_13510 [Chitinophagales bacterium]|nr:hypothetical protein [Chitinophagales bacterium]
MLKLLRKIRRNSIDEGNLKSYLIYAIGEILLIMIGILLALQVSNWNQKRIEHKKELKALIDLNKEFQLNEERIRTKQNARISIVPKLETYIRQISSGEVDYSSFQDFHSSHFIFGMTNPSNGVIDALISSGEITLISNDSLKYFLADWKNQVENLYENEQILWDSGLSYIESYSKDIPIPSHHWNNWNDNKLELAFKGLISNIEYKNKLIGFEGANKVVIEECNSVLTLLKNVLMLLENEINKHK